MPVLLLLNRWLHKERCHIWLLWFRFIDDVSMHRLQMRLQSAGAAPSCHQNATAQATFCFSASLFRHMFPHA